MNPQSNDKYIYILVFLYLLFIEITTFLNIYWLQQYYKYIKEKTKKTDSIKNNLGTVNLILKIIIYVLALILYFTKDVKNVEIFNIIGKIFIFILYLSIILSIAIASINIENYSSNNGKDFNNNKIIKNLQIVYLVFIVIFILLILLILYIHKNINN